MLLDYTLNYPDEARRQGLEGTVFVRVLINRNGETEDVMIAKSSGSPLLDSAAVRTARTFTFSPAMMGDETIQSWVVLPVEFILREVDNEQWLTEVKILQRNIAKEYDKEAIESLYNLYKQLIYSPWESKDLRVNFYIKEAILDSTSKLWDGYWFAYRANILLFIDIINRYPDSFTSLKARADFSDFFREEKITLRHVLSPLLADTLINRLSEAIED